MNIGLILVNIRKEVGLRKVECLHSEQPSNSQVHILEMLLQHTPETAQNVYGNMICIRQN